MSNPPQQATTGKWQEDRLAKSRLENLAKAREAQKAQRQKKEDGFTLSPVPNEVVPLEISAPLTSDVAIQSDRGESTSLLSQFILALVPLALPWLLNVAYVTVRDLYYDSSATSPSVEVRSRNKASDWQGQSVFRT